MLDPETWKAAAEDPNVQAQLSDAFGDTWQLSEDGIIIDGDEPMQEGEGDSYKAGDKVKDLRSDAVGTVVEPMAGGAVVELEDGTIVKTRSKFLELAGEGDPTMMKEEGEWAPPQSREDEEYGGQIHLIPNVQFSGDIESDLAGLPPEILDWMYGELESGDSIEDESGRAYVGADVQDVIQVLDWHGEGSEEMYEGKKSTAMKEVTDPTRDLVRQIVARALSESEKESTEEHDDDPALKGDQDELPDELQKNIIDAEEEEKEEVNELFGFGGPSKAGIEWLQQALNRFGTWKQQMLDGLEGRTHNDLRGLGDNFYKQYSKAAKNAPRGATQGKKNKGIVQVWDLLGKWVQGVYDLADMMDAGKDQRKDILPVARNLPGSELWHGNSEKPVDVATLVKGAVQESDEEQEEQIASNPEEFYDRLRQDRQTLSESWNKDIKSDRASMLNNRLMKAWFGKK